MSEYYKDGSALGFLQSNSTTDYWLDGEALSGALELSGTTHTVAVVVEGVSTLTAVLAQLHRLNPEDVSGSSAVAAALIITGSLEADPVTGSSTVSAHLLRVIFASVDVEGKSLVYADAKILTGVAGFSHGIGEVAGTLFVGIELAGYSRAVASASAVVDVFSPLAITGAEGESTITAALSVSRPLAAQIAGSSVVEAHMILDPSVISGSPAGASTVSGLAGFLHSAAAEVSGSSFLPAALFGKWVYLSTGWPVPEPGRSPSPAQGSSTLTVTLTADAYIEGVSHSYASASAELEGEFEIEGISRAVASVIPDLSGDFNGTQAVSHSLAVVLPADLIGEFGLAAEVSCSSVVDGLVGFWIYPEGRAHTTSRAIADTIQLVLLEGRAHTTSRAIALETRIADVRGRAVGDQAFSVTLTLSSGAMRAVVTGRSAVTARAIRDTAFAAAPQGLSQLLARLTTDHVLEGFSHGLCQIEAGPLRRTVDIEGRAHTSASAAAATLFLFRFVEGISRAWAGASAECSLTLPVSAAFSGASSVSSQLSGEVAVQAVVDGSSAVSAVPALIQDAAAYAHGVGGVLASMSKDVPVEGFAQTLGGASGDLMLRAEIHGIARCLGSASGALLGDFKLAGVSSGSSEVSASLDAGDPLLAAVASGRSDVTASLSGEYFLQAASAGVSEMTASARVWFEVEGRASTATSASAALGKTQLISGFSHAEGGAAAAEMNADQHVRATLAVSSSVSAALRSTGGITAALSGASQCAALLTRERDALGVSAGRSFLWVSLQSDGMLEGISAGTGQVIASPTLIVPMEARASTTGLCTGSVLAQKPVSGIARAVSGASADLLGVLRVQGTVSGGTTVSVRPGINGLTDASVMGLTSISAALTYAPGLFASAASGVSLAGGGISVLREVVGSASTTGAASGVLLRTALVSGISRGLSGAAGDLEGGTPQLAAPSVSGSSTVTASLTAEKPLAAAVTCSSQVVADVGAIRGVEGVVFVQMPTPRAIASLRAELAALVRTDAHAIAAPSLTLGIAAQAQSASGVSAAMIAELSLGTVVAGTGFVSGYLGWVLYAVSHGRGSAEGTLRAILSAAGSASGDTSIDALINGASVEGRSHGSSAMSVIALRTEFRADPTQDIYAEPDAADVVVMDTQDVYAEPDEADRMAGDLYVEKSGAR